MRRNLPAITAKSAESLAIEALSFLGEKPDALARFLSLAGIGPDTLRGAAREPGFLAAVLSYIADDAPLLLEFAARTGQEPETVARARTLLAGPDWERETA